MALFIVRHQHEPDRCPATEKAIKERDLSMMIYIRFVMCKGLRASHRWPKIAKMMNLPVEAQAHASTVLS